MHGDTTYFQHGYPYTPDLPRIKKYHPLPKVEKYIRGKIYPLTRFHGIPNKQITHFFKLKAQRLVPINSKTYPPLKIGKLISLCNRRYDRRFTFPHLYMSPSLPNFHRLFSRVYNGVIQPRLICAFVDMNLFKKVLQELFELSVEYQFVCIPYIYIDLDRPCFKRCLEPGQNSYMILDISDLFDWIVRNYKALVISKIERDRFEAESELEAFVDIRCRSGLTYGVRDHVPKGTELVSGQLTFQCDNCQSNIILDGYFLARLWDFLTPLDEIDIQPTTLVNYTKVWFSNEIPEHAVYAPRLKERLFYNSDDNFTRWYITSITDSWYYFRDSTYIAYNTKKKTTTLLEIGEIIDEFHKAKFRHASPLAPRRKEDLYVANAIFTFDFLYLKHLDYYHRRYLFTHDLFYQHSILYIHPIILQIPIVFKTGKEVEFDMESEISFYFVAPLSNEFTCEYGVFDAGTTVYTSEYEDLKLDRKVFEYSEIPDKHALFQQVFITPKTQYLHKRFLFSWDFWYSRTDYKNTRYVFLWDFPDIKNRHVTYFIDLPGPSYPALGSIIPFPSTSTRYYNTRYDRIFQFKRIYIELFAGKLLTFEFPYIEIHKRLCDLKSYFWNINRAFTFGKADYKNLDPIKRAWEGTYCTESFWQLYLEIYAPFLGFWGTYRINQIVDYVKQNYPHWGWTKNLPSDPDKAYQEIVKHIPWVNDCLPRYSQVKNLLIPGKKMYKNAPLFLPGMHDEYYDATFFKDGRPFTLHNWKHLDWEEIYHIWPDMGLYIPVQPLRGGLGGGLPEYKKGNLKALWYINCPYTPRHYIYRNFLIAPISPRHYLYPMGKRVKMYCIHLRNIVVYWEQKAWLIDKFHMPNLDEIHVRQHPYRYTRHTRFFTGTRDFGMSTVLQFRKLSADTQELRVSLQSNRILNPWKDIDDTNLEMYKLKLSTDYTYDSNAKDTLNIEFDEPQVQDLFLEYYKPELDSND